MNPRYISITDGSPRGLLWYEWARHLEMRWFRVTTIALVLFLAACRAKHPADAAERALGPGARCTMLAGSFSTRAHCVKDGVRYECIGDRDTMACAAMVSSVPVEAP